MGSHNRVREEVGLALSKLRQSAPKDFFTNGGCGALSAALHEVFGADLIVMGVDIVHPESESQHIPFFHAMARIDGISWDIDGPRAIERWKRKARSKGASRIFLRAVTFDELVTLNSACGPVEINAMSLRGILASLVRGACKARYSHLAKS